MTRQQWMADASLLVIAAIWGGTFVMVKDAVQAFPVFAFLTVRFSIATISLLAVRSWLETRYPFLQAPPSLPARQSVMVGGVLGLVLTAGYGFQTLGLQYTTPAKAGFITGLSVVLVPALAAAFSRHRPEGSVQVGVSLTTLGLGVLSLDGDWRPQYGDVLVLFCAFAFALHILLTGRWARYHPPLMLTAGQLGVTAALSGLLSWFWERPWPAITAPVLGAALFTGLFASTLAFSVQTVAQRFTPSTHTALILTTEPVFAAAFSVVWGAEPLTGRILLGGSLILLGMLAVEAVKISGGINRRQTSVHPPTGGPVR